MKLLLLGKNLEIFNLLYLLTKKQVRQTQDTVELEGSWLGLQFRVI